MRPMGWRYESYRHMLARKGIRTASRKSGFVGRVRDVPITMQKVPVGHVYPASPDDVKRVLERQKPEDIKGLKGVEFVRPRDKSERNAWARYVRSKRVVKVFSQPVRGEKVGGQDAGAVKEHMLSYVLPHELGHHLALSERDITDGKLSVAEGRADAFAAGCDVEDNAVVKEFAKQHEGVDER